MAIVLPLHCFSIGSYPYFAARRQRCARGKGSGVAMPVVRSCTAHGAPTALNFEQFSCVDGNSVVGIKNHLYFGCCCCYCCCFFCVCFFYCSQKSPSIIHTHTHIYIYTHTIYLTLTPQVPVGLRRNRPCTVVGGRRRFVVNITVDVRISVRGHLFPLIPNRIISYTGKL